ncbi:MAG: acyltransferase family protein, partial [bacterium]
LIANSHLSDYYPIPQLAGDGLLGNSLFFLLSGYGLAKGDAHARRRAGDWFGRRLRKIYPSVVIVLLATALYDFGSLHIHRPIDVIIQLVWPSNYPFIMQITTFYVVYFLWSRSPLGRWPIALCLVMIPLYIAGWLLSPHELRTHILHWFFYFQVMMMGVVVARYRLNEQKISRKWILTGLLISSLAYLFVKFMLSRRGLAVEYVSILHLLVLPVMYFFVMFSAEAQTVQWLARGGLLPQFATWLAGNTLEVYLVHYPVLENRHVLAAPSPLNLAAFWILTFALTWVVGKTRDSLLQRLEKTGPVKP